MGEEAEGASFSCREYFDLEKQSHHIPLWCIYPFFLIIIGGFIAWGTLSGGKGLRVEEDWTGLIFLAVLITFSVIATYMMYTRLDVLSDPDRRFRMYKGVDDESPLSEQRHSLGVSFPWDSYQWAAAFLLVRKSLIIFGVIIPVLRGNDRYLSYTFVGLYVVFFIPLLYLSFSDPSKGITEKVPYDHNPEYFSLYCKYKGCKQWYRGEYRKHCRACNKCITGFDHHCPFLNQCIGSNNYTAFYIMLSAYNAIMFLCIGSCVYVLYQLYNPGSDIHREGGRIWGKIMFACFTCLMALFSLLQLPMLCPLLIFHTQLCWKQWMTGEFHSSYMFTTPCSN